MKDFLRLFLFKLNDLITPKNIVSFAVFYCPFTIGSWNPLNYIYVLLGINLLLLPLLIKKIINHKRILKFNYLIPIAFFVLSFYTSMMFGLEYKQMNDFTDYDSSLGSVFFVWSSIIVMQLPFIYFFYLSINSYKDLSHYIKIILLSGVVVNFVGILMYFVGFQFTELKRIGLSFDDANYLGRFEVIIISISFIYILFSKISFLKKILFGVLIAVSFNFLLLSISRAALLSLGILSVFLLLFYPSRVLKYSLISFNVLLFLSLILLFGSQKVDTLGGGTDLASSFIDLSNATRVALMYASIFCFFDYPVFGIGIYNFFNAYLNHGYMPVDMPLGAKITVVHSWFFSTLAEQGLFGIIPLLIIFFNLTRDLFKFLLKDKGEQRFFGLIMISLLFILLFNGFVNPIFYSEVQFSVIAGLVGGYLKVSTLTAKRLNYESSI